MSRKLAYIVAFAWGVIALSETSPLSAQTNPGVRPRPNPANLQVQQLSPQLEQLLKVWSQRSAQIHKLQGTHHRFVYDSVFSVDKRATGAFYYEAPGKGRIDLKPAEIPRGAVSKKVDKTGKPYKVQADRAERWICDGKDIWQVNEATRQIERFPIPPENQGQNIMDGPMPFLFGMPPAKAKRRYFLKLINEDQNRAVLQVNPRLQVDAANWKEAKVILDKTLYLPTAVQLTDPAGNLVTTYTFGEFKINDDNNKNWIVKFITGGKDEDPFRPNFKGYQVTVHNPGKENANPGAAQMPSVAGLGWKPAQDLLEKLGSKVQIYTGQKAPQQKLTHVVYEQKPAAKTPLQAGQPVVLTIYDKALVQMVQAPAAGRVPAVSGLFWKDAGKKLEEAGYKVKYLPGKAADAKEKVYMVYEQVPGAGQQLQEGGEVTLTVYNKMP